MKSFQRRNFQIVSDLIFTPKIDIYCTHDLSFHYVLVLLSIMLHKAHFVEYYGIVLFKFAAFFFCNHLISTTLMNFSCSVLQWCQLLLALGYNNHSSVCCWTALLILYFKSLWYFSTCKHVNSQTWLQHNFHLWYNNHIWLHLFNTADCSMEHIVITNQITNRTMSSKKFMYKFW